MTETRQEAAEIVASLSAYLSQQKEIGFDEIYCSRQPGAAVPAPRAMSRLFEAYRNCNRCSLSRLRKSFVFGVGSEKAELVFVGEAPGRDEDIQGEPFVGTAGQLLTRIIQAIGLKRSDVYITNVLKCRPPENRDPSPEETKACLPLLAEQLKIIEPKLICALGRIAAQALLQTNAPLNRLRGTVHEYGNIGLVVTYHPAALLRSPQYKRPTWEDMQMLRKVYDEKKADQS